MDKMIERMRLDFQVAVVWCGWSEEDQAELGAEIKAAIESGDQDAIKAWANWLAEQSGSEFLAARCRLAEQRIHHEAELARRKAA